MSELWTPENDAQVTPEKSNVRPWRNKFRSATEAIWGDGEITRGPGIWWGTHIFPTKEEAEKYGQGFVDGFPEWAEQYGVEYLGAFEERP